MLYYDCVFYLNETWSKDRHHLLDYQINVIMWSILCQTVQQIAKTEMWSSQEAVLGTALQCMERRRLTAENSSDASIKKLFETQQHFSLMVYL